MQSALHYIRMHQCDVELADPVYGVAPRSRIITWTNYQLMSSRIWNSYDDKVLAMI